MAIKFENRKMGKSDNVRGNMRRLGKATHRRQKVGEDRIKSAIK